MLTVRVFRLGYLGSVDLRSVVKRLLVHPIQAVVGDAVPNIGGPDIHGGLAYSSQHLFSFFPTEPDSNNTVSVGVVLSPIEGNFYTRTRSGKWILVSLYQREEVCEKAGRSMVDSIVLSILAEILSARFQALTGLAYTDLFHEDTRGCLFDFVQHKPHMAYKLRSAQIDSICRGKLVGANVPESLVRAAEKILARTRTISLYDSIAIGLKNPPFSFVVGTMSGGLAINILTSAMLGELEGSGDFAVAAIILALAIFLIAGHWILLRIREQRKLD